MKVSKWVSIWQCKNCDTVEPAEYDWNHAYCCPECGFGSNAVGWRKTSSVKYHKPNILERLMGVKTKIEIRKETAPKKKGRPMGAKNKKTVEKTKEKKCQD